MNCGGNNGNGSTGRSIVLNVTVVQDVVVCGGYGGVGNDRDNCDSANRSSNSISTLPDL